MIDLEAQIREEMERYRQRHEQEFGDEWYLFFFNNFDTKLPGGFVYGPEISGKKLYLDEPETSEKRRNQTGYEFQEECRTAVLEAGLTPEQVIEARKRGRTREFYDMLFPVYVILRKRGYIHYKDLTA